VLAGALFVVAIVAAALLLTSGEEPDTPSSPTSTQAEPDRLALGADPLWRSDARLIRGPDGVQLRDGLLLTTTEEAIQAVDVETGESRWERAGVVPAYAMDALLIGHDDDLGVLVTEPCGASGPGLALLSAADGEVVWRTPIPPAEDCAGHERRLRAANDTVALVAVIQVGSLADVRTVAVDVDTGAVRWEHRGAWPYAVAGGVALVSTTEPDGGTATTTTSVRGATGELTALNVATGEPVWRTTGRYPVAQPVLVADDIVAVATADAEGENEALRLLAASSGREVAVLSGDAPPHSCATDLDTLIACATVDQLLTFQVDAPGVATADLTTGVADVRGVVRGWITVRLADDTLRVLDRDGNTIAEAPPGLLLAVVGDVAIFENGETTVAYRLG
jgi:putative pyrroloquinoline-quinone binding quinoprotein